VNAAKFRQLALDLPGATEGSHMGHADFRVGGKVFASLGPAPEEAWGMVKVGAEQQAVLVRGEPEVFRPATGAWGRSGCTMVTLRAARVAVVKEALSRAWRNVAPKSMLRAFEEEGPEGAKGEEGGAQGAARTSASGDVAGGVGNRRGSSNSSPRKREPR
jgi:hypothetical protein